MALCMTTDRSFQRIAVSAASVMPTMFRPRKTTLPPVISAGGESNWAMANSKVDFPQPDSPTIARNSFGLSEKLTWSTARTTPDSRRYSTDRSRTSRMASGRAASPSSGSGSAALLDTGPPQRPQRRVPDLIKGVVEQGEGGAESDDPQPA